MQIHDLHPTTTREPLDFLQAWGAAHSTVKVHHLDNPSPTQSTPAGALLSAVPRSPPVPDEAIQALLGAGVCISLTEASARKARPDDSGAAAAVRARKTPAAPAPSAQRRIPLRGDHRVFKFERPDSLPQPFQFAAPSGPSRGALPPGLLKRVRHGLDVDGPNTADLGCKKRRLRTELITSRLSRAYSQPATHILNREGQKSGDKRFLKMATAASIGPLARRIAHFKATSYVRYSAMNRIRKRLGIAWPIPVVPPGKTTPAASSVEAQKESGAGLLELKTKTHWTPPSLLTASRGQFVPLEGKGLHHLTTSSLTLALPRGAPLPTTPPRNKAVQVCRSSKSSPTSPHSPDVGAGAKSLSPAVYHPISSPERPLDCASYDELDEDSFASRHMDDDNYSDTADDPDQVYSDFSVIFGPGGDGQAQDGSSYEEYLDELDGISWVAI